MTQPKTAPNALRPSRWLTPLLVHAILGSYTLLAIAPVILVVMNSFKGSQAIFQKPYLPPIGELFDPVGYATVFKQTAILHYLGNSLLVTLGSIGLILLLGAMTAFGLTEYRYRGRGFLTLYALIGLMIPIRLATVSILKLMVALNLQDTIWSLILVYSTQGLPMAIFVLSQYMRQVPSDLKDAARLDGASEYQVFWLVVPLMRPALATLAIFVMLPIWNDLWFPLVLAPGEASRTLTLGAQQFLGQFQTDWSALLAMLTLAIAPVLVLYLIFSRQLIRGLTAGTVKG
ncbi:carbohydrate ABC transporter permease [Herpetosiphon giganteus]|uniref:carbohydrate ABC transporter permease n=1 Tax=Herpetosiphon giganteus TaxID=2029754 RepID=UPI001EF80658|nr:carbohydrate ABC transporter permease [Herpetosiphon giganteus]MBM7843937.1 raffinose/stachyose/melibiose transport system permease protein [Herpetosiphon giganteus]